MTSLRHYLSNQVIGRLIWLVRMFWKELHTVCSCVLPVYFLVLRSSVDSGSLLDRERRLGGFCVIFVPWFEDEVRRVL